MGSPYSNHHTQSQRMSLGWTVLVVDGRLNFACMAGHAVKASPQIRHENWAYGEGRHFLGRPENLRGANTCYMDADACTIGKEAKMTHYQMLGAFQNSEDLTG